MIDLILFFEERENKHSHVWIIPRYAWMNEICDRIIKKYWDYT